ncbi:nuclear transport factor 2 family protein [Actinoplanes sp. NPDC051513]|uniref:nuclear transport factor 2 family protein n=1 Tax=Actinoplanes sp. NPDC051513 TaxID=3363908 RepID=UPI0037977FC8
MNTIDTTSLSKAIETRDADGVLAWYADDATLTVVDHDHPPATPLVLSGTEAIGAYYRDVCGRNINHEVRDMVSTADALAYTQHCRYPDGTAVVCASVATTRDGRINNQTAVQAWDS